MRGAAVVFALAATLSGQTIEGDLVDALSGAPVAGARVAAGNLANSRAVAVSDAAGHFQLQVAAAASQSGVSGGYNLWISRSGYLQRQHLALPGPTDARIELMPQAVISGQVTDEDGFPVQHANVEALRSLWVNGHQELHGGGTSTDDQGRFRIARLPAGRYFLKVIPGGWTVAWDGRYVPLYYPKSLVPRDQDRMELKAGEERTVDFRLTKFEGVTVSGRVRMPENGRPGGDFHVTLFSGTDAFDGRTSQRPDGRFTIQHVPPGRYRLRAVTGNVSPPGAGDFVIEQSIDVADSALRDITLDLRAVEPMDVAGMLEFEGGAVPQPMNIVLQPSNGKGASARSNPDGSFVVKGILPGEYKIQVQQASTVEAQPGWVISERIGEREFLPERVILDNPPAAPLRITLSAALVRLAVEVRDPAGHPVPGAYVMVQPKQRGSPQRNTAGADGIARVNIFPGDYRIYVLPDDSAADLFMDADWLKTHESDFPPVRVGPGLNKAAVSVTLH